jgi:hypothetical protein
MNEYRNMKIEARIILFQMDEPRSYGLWIQNVIVILHVLRTVCLQVGCSVSKLEVFLPADYNWLGISPPLLVSVSDIQCCHSISMKLR